MSTIPKDFKQIIKPYVKSGELTLLQGGKHIQLVHKDGRKLAIPGTPSCSRAVSNFKQQLKRFLNCSVEATCE